MFHGIKIEFIFNVMVSLEAFSLCSFKRRFKVWEDALFVQFPGRCHLSLMGKEYFSDKIMYANNNNKKKFYERIHFE